MKKTLVAAALAAGLVLGTAGTALAGEYNGKGEPVPGGVTGKSACSFSGRDVPDDVEGNPPGFDDDDITGGGSDQGGPAGRYRKTASAMRVNCAPISSSVPTAGGRMMTRVAPASWKRRIRSRSAGCP